jgi:hypothetical protein
VLITAGSLAQKSHKISHLARPKRALTPLSE